MPSTIAAPAAGQAGARPLVAVAVMVALAGLDFTGTMLAKEWTITRAAWQLVAGGAAFLALFVVLAMGLRYAEMSILTLGWIVVLQTAVIIVDRSRYGASISMRGWMAMIAILVLQGYLMIGGTGQPNGAPADQPSASSAAS